VAPPLTVSPDAVATLVERLAQNALATVRAETAAAPIGAEQLVDRMRCEGNVTAQAALVLEELARLGRHIDASTARACRAMGVTPDLCPSETSGPAALQRPEPRPTERTFDR
jgi:hypothetical protein